MTYLPIGREAHGQIYKTVLERARDRIMGDRLGLPSPFHDRIDLAHARMYALSPAAGEVPSRSLALEALQAAGLPEQDILDVLVTIEAHDGRSLVTDGTLQVQLKQLGYRVTPDNVARARPTATAAMAEACLSALSGGGAPSVDQLGVPVPPAMALFGSAATSQVGQVVTAPMPEPTSTVTTAPIVGDRPFSEVADVVISWKQREGLWDADRAREVRASVKLFVAANGDIPFSTLRQEHLFNSVDLMGRLPKRYNHFMVKGQGGFAAALASVAPAENETKEQEAERKKKIGLHSATRNKHLTWTKAVVEGAAKVGFTKHILDFTGLRHGAKQMKKTDKRKKNEKRPNWTVETFSLLTSGPVYEGCAGIDLRFERGDEVIHDGVYWSPLINLNICGRPSEAAGVAAADVFPDAPIPYIYVRTNSLRKLKVEDGERKVPIHWKLIEVGFLDYVRAIQAAGYKALFPEFVHPEGKLDFDWMMRRQAINPARALHFPDGTGLEIEGKSPDGHSLRGTGRTALRNHGVELPMRNYVSGHIDGAVGVEVYEEDPPLEMVRDAIEALNPFFEHLQQRPLNLRPADRMKFGSPRGRPRKA